MKDRSSSNPLQENGANYSLEFQCENIADSTDILTRGIMFFNMV